MKKDEILEVSLRKALAEEAIAFNIALNCCDTLASKFFFTIRSCIRTIKLYQDFLTIH